jgi:hypothetical protein
VRFDDRTEGKCILRKLGEWRFLHTDLIPIFTQHLENARLVEAAGRHEALHFLKQMRNSNAFLVLTVELLVPLTWPIDPKEPVYVEQMQYMRTYKAAMTDKSAVQSMFRFLLRYLSKEPR